MKLTVNLFLLIGVFVFADEVIIAPNKDSALKACEEKAAASPLSLRDEMLSSCRCIVEHTDFEQIETLSELEKSEKILRLHKLASDACLSK